MRAAADTLEKNSGLYAKMGQTTGDAAEGVVELTKSGLSLHDALKAVNGTMVLAKAGALSVPTPRRHRQRAEHVPPEGPAAGKVANYLANAANISSADVSDLAESLKYVALSPLRPGCQHQADQRDPGRARQRGHQGLRGRHSLRTFLLNLQAPATAGV
jgi:hypothetical protein